MTERDIFEDIERRIAQCERALDRDASYQPGMPGRGPMELALAAYYQAHALVRIGEILDNYFTLKA